MIVHQCKTIDETVRLLAKHKDCRVIAGGTDLIIDIRNNKISPEVLIDISGIEELKSIEENDDCIEIGAGVTFTEIVESEVFEGNLYGLKKACRMVGSPQIRNKGTIGGNIINGSPAADSVPPLLSLDCIIIFERTRGIREVRLEEYIKDKYNLGIKEDELLRAIRFKKTGGVLSFAKLGLRKALAISRLSIATLLELDDEKKVKSIRVSSGSLGKYPMREKEVEEFLLDKSLDEDTIDEALKVLQNAMSIRLGSRPTLPYKKRAVESIFKEALNQGTRDFSEVVS